VVDGLTIKKIANIQLSKKGNSILILTVPRSGSTSLCSSLGKSLTEMNEPLNDTQMWQSPINTKTFIDKISRGNVVVKIMPNHLPSDWKKKEYLSFIDKIIPYFKYVILLDRKDINEQYTSWRNLMNYLLNEDRYPEWTEAKINFGERFFWLQKYLIRQISSKYNLKLYFYEDIFFNNYSTMFNELNIDLDLVDTRYLDPQFKYKKNVFKPELPKQLI
jgi:hypothetical protein